MDEPCENCCDVCVMMEVRNSGEDGGEALLICSLRIAAISVNDDDIITADGGRFQGEEARVKDDDVAAFY